MKILLYNDNPVVRKLVALSAQKTKDELSVVWSVEEIEESGYDLVIMDDALYSDETFESLKETVTFKSSLLMATRGNGVPAGFDNVINKPFLPTDLVDLFAKIDKDIASKSSDKVIDLAQESLTDRKEESFAAINLDDSFLGDLESDDEDFILDDLGDFSDDMGENDLFGELASLEEEKFPAILDQEEVEEVRGLLEETENDEPLKEEEISTFGIDDFDFGALEAAEEIEMPEEADLEEEKEPEENELVLDDEILSDQALKALDLKIRQAIGSLEAEDFEAEIEGAESFDLEEFDLDEEEESADVLSPSEAPFALTDDFHDDMESEDEKVLEADDLSLDDELLDDEEFGDLEPEEAEEESDDIALERLALTDIEESEMVSMADDFGGLDELDMLDERELKLAIGEEIEEASEIRPVENGHAALDEEVELSAHPSLPSVVSHEGVSEGVEALHTLLKALSNEDVVKSLKGLNISININFGNDK